MSHDAAILARAILPLCGICRVCGCHGDACSLEAGERCCWMDDLRTLCSNPRCVTAAAQRRKKDAWEQKRATAQAEQTSSVPQWLRLRRREAETARKRRTKKTKGRAA